MMDVKAVAALLSMNKANFPNAYRDMSKEEKAALLDSWTYQLKNYDRTLVQEAFMRALQYCKFPVTLADIFSELRKMKAAVEKPVDQLWQEFLQASQKCKDLSRGFYYTFVEVNGKTQGQNFKDQAKTIFAGLEPELQAYCGNLDRLISFADIDSAYLEQVIYPAFRRSVMGIRERAEVRQSLPNDFLQQLTGGLVDKMSLLEGKAND